MGVPGGGHDGRQPGAVDKQLNPARIIPMADKWNFAETALSHAERMLEILVNLDPWPTNGISPRRHYPTPSVCWRFW